MFQVMTSAELGQLPVMLPAPSSQQIEPTWPAIAKAAPMLLSLEPIAHAASPDDLRAWSGIKRQFSKCVGWEAADSRLATHHHYDVVYDHLLALFETEGR